MKPAPQHPLPAPVKLYHRATIAAARSILRDGFNDGAATWIMPQHGDMQYGIFLSDMPLNRSSGVQLCVTLTCDGSRINAYECHIEDQPHRGWLIPVGTLRELTFHIERLE